MLTVVSVIATMLNEKESAGISYRTGVYIAALCCSWIVVYPSVTIRPDPLAVLGALVVTMGISGALPPEGEPRIRSTAISAAIFAGGSLAAAVITVIGIPILADTVQGVAGLSIVTESILTSLVIECLSG